MSLVEAIWCTIVVVGWLDWISKWFEAQFRGRTKVPVAVVVEDAKDFELKTVPGGVVRIRQMTYGERLVRNSMQGKMRVSADRRSEFAGEIEMAIDKIAMWDFTHLVVEHNLEDADGRKLNFKNEADVRKLRSNVGEEIGTYIDKMNNFEDVEEGN